MKTKCGNDISNSLILGGKAFATSLCLCISMLWNYLVTGGHLAYGNSRGLLLVNAVHLVILGHLDKNIKW